MHQPNGVVADALDLAIRRYPYLLQRIRHAPTHRHMLAIFYYEQIVGEYRLILKERPKR